MENIIHWILRSSNPSTLAVIKVPSKHWPCYCLSLNVHHKWWGRNSWLSLMCDIIKRRIDCPWVNLPVLFLLTDSRITDVCYLCIQHALKLVYVLFVCRCYLFDLKIDNKSNINCSIKLRLLWCFKSTSVLKSSFISLMADFFQTAYIEEPTHVSKGIYNIVKTLIASMESHIRKL